MLGPSQACSIELSARGDQSFAVLGTLYIFHERISQTGTGEEMPVNVARKDVLTPKALRLLAPCHGIPRSVDAFDGFPLDDSRTMNAVSPRLIPRRPQQSVRS